MNQYDLERGMRLYKNFMLNLAEAYCEKPSDSAAFHPNTVKQGQVKTAQDLLEHLKRATSPTSEELK